MKNINEVLKENIEDFDKQFGDLWSKVNDTKKIKFQEA